jgi:hypothetical protein
MIKHGYAIHVPLSDNKYLASRLQHDEQVVLTKQPSEKII